MSDPVPQRCELQPADLGQLPKRQFLPSILEGFSEDSRSLHGCFSHLPEGHPGPDPADHFVGRNSELGGRLFDVVIHGY